MDGDGSQLREKAMGLEIQCPLPPWGNLEEYREQEMSSVIQLMKSIRKKSKEEEEGDGESETERMEEQEDGDSDDVEEEEEEDTIG